MTTVKQLKEFLNTLPEDMPVEVLTEYHESWYSWIGWTDLDISDYSDTCEILGGTLCLGRN